MNIHLPQTNQGRTRLQEPSYSCYLLTEGVLWLSRVDLSIQWLLPCFGRHKKRIWNTKRSSAIHFGMASAGSFVCVCVRVSFKMYLGQHPPPHRTSREHGVELSTSWYISCSRVSELSAQVFLAHENQYLQNWFPFLWPMFRGYVSCRECKWLYEASCKQHILSFFFSTKV